MTAQMHQAKIEQLQLLEQGLHALSSQRQELEAKQLEADAVISQLVSQPVSYKVIGNIMVKADSATLVEDLKQIKESAIIRIKSIEKQEQNMKVKAKDLQAEVMKGMM